MVHYLAAIDIVWACPACLVIAFVGFLYFLWLSARQHYDQLDPLLERIRNLTIPEAVRYTDLALRIGDPAFTDSIRCKQRRRDVTVLPGTNATFAFYNRYEEVWIDDLHLEFPEDALVEDWPEGRFLRLGLLKVEDEPDVEIFANVKTEEVIGRDLEGKFHPWSRSIFHYIVQSYLLGMDQVLEWLDMVEEHAARPHQE